MSYFGAAPTAKPLTSSDLEDGIVTNAKLGTDISAAKLTAGTLADARFPATLPALNGSNLTNISAGKIGQVVQSETDYYHNVGATTSNVTLKFDSSTNWTPSITPSASSSKILIIVNFMLYADAGNGNNEGRTRMKFYETVGGTETQFLDDYEANGIYDHGGHGNWYNHPYNRSFLRSTNTTSAVTYRFAMHGMASNVNTALNIGGSQSSGTMNKSSFIMMEVLA
mgnify:FL=1